jgi:C1A family cysteine protease
MAIDTATLNNELRAVQAGWTAQENPQSKLSLDEKRALLGMNVTPSDQALAANPPAAAAPAGPAVFAPAVDWRNRNGNHVTPVKDQRRCGSCVSFCCAALVESMASIELGQLLDLSEADSHFNSNHGPSCGGWYADACLEQIKQRGLVNEAALPYMSAFDNPPQADPGDPTVWKAYSRPTPNRAASQVSINSHGLISDITARKTYLSDVGPCSASFDVYEDFYSYGTGVYHHVSGDYVGGHCVEVIGYSEAE